VGEEQWAQKRGSNFAKKKTYERGGPREYRFFNGRAWTVLMVKMERNRNGDIGSRNQVLIDYRWVLRTRKGGLIVFVVEAEDWRRGGSK